MEKDEIERKFVITEDEKKHIETFLSKNGFIFEGKKQLVDEYYIVKENVEYLRIRHTDPATLDHHTVVSDDTCEEISVPIADVTAMKNMLVKLGYSLQVTVDKTREAYTNTKVEVVLDYLDNLGYFIEIEVYDGTKEDMDTLAAELGLKNEIQKKGYPDLLLDALNH